MRVLTLVVRLPLFLPMQALLLLLSPIISLKELVSLTTGILHSYHDLLPPQVSAEPYVEPRVK